MKTNRQAHESPTIAVHTLRQPVLSPPHSAMLCRWETNPYRCREILSLEMQVEARSNAGVLDLHSLGMRTESLIITL